MIKITKAECDFLLNGGCKFGEDLHRTYTKHKTYYATESKKVLKKLEIYKNRYNKEA